MKKLGLIILLMFAGISWGQQLAVTATITDSDSQTWNNGTWSVSLQCLSNQCNYNGTPVSSVAQAGSLSSGGALAVTLYNSSTITPSGATYVWTLCSNTSAPCSVFNAPVTTTNLSSLLSSLIRVPRFGAGPTAKGYLNVEVNTVPFTGATYFNVTSQTQLVWNGSAWVSGDSGGGAAFTAPGIQYATSTTAARVATPADLGNAITLNPGINSMILMSPQTTQSVFLGANNTLMGVGAGAAIVGANEITAFGSNACPVFAGQSALGVEDGSNTCIGSAAGLNLVSTFVGNPYNGSVDNNFLGQKSGTNVVNSANCSFLGVHAGTELTNCNATTIVGAHTLDTSSPSSESSNSVFIGSFTANGIGNKDNDVVVGSLAAIVLTTGTNDNIMGENAAIHLTIGSFNTVNGYDAGIGLVAGGADVIEGAFAGPAVDDSNDTWIGATSGQNVTGTPSAVTVVGFGDINSGQITTSVLIGDSIAAAGGSTVLTADTVVGSGAMHNILTGTDNTVVGKGAGAAMTGAESHNEMLGSLATTGTGVSNSAQIGVGTNSTSHTMQFNSWNFLNDSGGGTFSSLSNTLMQNESSATVASATTIAPVTPFVILTGTTAIATITLPSGFTSGCFDAYNTSTNATTTAGNIAAVYTLTAATQYRICYVSSISKWTVK